MRTRLFITLALALVSCTAWGAQFQVTEIYSQGSELTSINNKGEVLGKLDGSCFFASGQNLNMIDPVGGVVSLVELTDSGYAACADQYGYCYSPYIWSKDGFVKLPAPEGYDTVFITAVNEGGTAVGRCFSSGDYLPFSCVWEGGVPHAFDLPPGPPWVPGNEDYCYTEFYDINNRGDIAGSYGPSSYLYVCADGVLNILNCPVVTEGPTERFLSINDTGYAAYGEFLFKDDQYTRMVNIAINGSPHPLIHSRLNNKVQAVVSTLYSWEYQNKGAAWFWDGSSAWNLMGEVDLPGLTRIYGADINDQGQIAATGYFSDGSYRGLVLSPVPEPSSMLALFGGMTALGGLALRRRAK